MPSFDPLGLLRARSERHTCRRAAHESDEIPPSRQRTRCYHISQRCCALQQNQGANVRDGSQNRTHAPQQTDCYSIASSARPERGSGTAMPRVLAAVALMNSSSFVSCCTVRSDCFSPLRMRAVSAG